MKTDNRHRNLNTDRMLKYKLLVLVAIILQVQFASANISLNALFSDHMVVQRETNIPVWGWADAGEKISITTSWGAKAATVAGQDGTWKLKLKTPKAGGPFTISVIGNNSIVLNDVLSGEVWLCSGQSNMDFNMARFANKAADPTYQPLSDYNKNEIETSNDAWLRRIQVPHTTSLFEKKKNIKGDWIIANDPKQTAQISAVAYFFAKELRQKLNVPIGLIECAWGGTRVQPWISEEAYMEDNNQKEYFEASRKEAKQTIEKLDAVGYVDTAYESKLAQWKEKGSKGQKPAAETHPTKNSQLPATLYNGMLSAVIPYAIKGAIWYQGESNAVYMPGEYEKYFTTMINGWRKDWQQGNFPFYWAQLAGCDRGKEENELGWATVNDQLRKTLKLPNTGMAVLHDIGEGKDIHPHNKFDVGKRLALWALKNDYHLQVSAQSGPLYKSKIIRGDIIEVEFDEAGSGLMAGQKKLMNDAVPVNEPLKWFEIAGMDGVWKTAQAKIIAKNKIEVWSPEVANPINVRYAWWGNPEGANLYNKEGLPAAVFSSQ